MFGWESDPAKVTNWPIVEQVVSQLLEQQSRYLAAVGRMTNSMRSASPSMGGYCDSSSSTRCMMKRII